MDDVTSISPSGYRVSDITIDPARRRVRRNGEDIELGKLSYKLLVTLVRLAPRVVTRDELVDQVWDGRYVNPATIKQRFVLLRQALGDDASEPRYIRVVRGHGYTVIPRVEALFDRSAARPLLPAYIAGALLAIVLSAVIYRSYIAPTPPLDPPAIAVLPFENLSPEPDDSFFAVGLHEEIIDRLAQIDGLRVLSRQSVLRFSGTRTAIGEIARELGADAVMAGTVNYRDGHVRIGTRLVDPESGIQLWSNTYERDFSDIFEIQAEIAMSVAGALGVKLGVHESNAFRGAGTDSIEAYEAFLAGLYALADVQGQDRAISFFRKATELDPDYAAAWAQMGFAYAAKTFYASPERTRDVLDTAMPIVLRAVELDPQSARAAALLGFVRYFRLDWIGAEEEYARAIDLSAEQYTLAQHAGMLVRAGRLTAARSEFEAAEAMEPSFGRPARAQAQVSIAQGQYAEARELVSTDEVAIRRQRLLLSIALNEGNPDAIRDAMSGVMAVDSSTSQLYTRLLHKLESSDDALAVVRAVHDDGNMQWPSKHADIALFAAYFGDPQLALKSMSEELDLSTLPISMLWYPLMSEVRQLPEFKDLVTDLNLVAYWRAYGWPDACTPLGEADFQCL